MNCRRRQVAISVALLLTANFDGNLIAAAFAQPATEVPTDVAVLDKITVTGTRIPAIDGQTGLPVQVITRDEIERANFQTAAELIQAFSTTFSAFTEAQALGSTAQPGFAAAALRGIGHQATLVLLNGRRIANYAFTTIGADLNAIPMSAVERVEVLRDGASAIYGSDAMAGVINFILRKNYQGVEAQAQYTSPEHTGGYAKRYSVTAGYGDPSSNGFNAFVTFDYQKFGGIQARDRPFAARVYIPSENLDRTNIHSSPANVDTSAGVRNPTGDPSNGYRNPSCDPPRSFPTSAFQDQCRFDGTEGQTIVDPSERVNAVASLNWQLTRDHALFLNGIYTRNDFAFGISPLPVSNQVTFRGVNGFRLPPTSPFYPHAFAAEFGLDGKPLNVYWRATELGPRIIAPTSEQWSVVAGMEGNIAGWDYDGALNYNQSTVDTVYAGSNARESALIPLLNSGVVNPFGSNAQTVIDALAATEVNRTLRTGKASLTSLDFHVSKEVHRLPAGPVAVAAGVDARRERIEQVSDPSLESGDIINVGALPSLAGSRTVLAVFAEASAPLFPALEADVAVRYDHYSDFGSTTNPKLSLRWQPHRNLLLRASAGTGFFAPSLTGLHQPSILGFTNQTSDPARCRTAAQDCNRPFLTVFGGNPHLKATNSNQWSVGGVWAPMTGLSLGVDYVSLLQKNRIGAFSVPEIFSQCPDGVSGSTCYLVHRGSIDPSHPALPGPIVQIDQALTNLGNFKVTAVDVSLQYRGPAQNWGAVSIMLAGTYTIQDSPQQLGGNYVNQVNHYVPGVGVAPYWHHFLMLDWTYGPWSVTVTENYQTGGYDQPPAPNSGGRQRFIGDYDIWNIGVAYKGFKNWALAAGIRNLFDRDPPFSVQTQSSQFGYDPSYADPHGRLFWAALKYVFH
jgi:iron complex outermembrane recepter protein